MRCEMPFTTLHEALAAAVYRDMPDIEYEDRDWDAWRKLSREQQQEALKNKSGILVRKTRRPTADELVVDMFQQTWGSTALGYGGIGGAAMTTAYTVVITKGNDVCVYFGCGRLAYRLNLHNMAPTGRAAYFSDLRDHVLADVMKAATRYV